MVVYVAAVVASFFVATAPAAAAPVDQIWAVVTNASVQNETVLNDFAVAASNAQNKAELDAARTTGHNRLEAIWYSSYDALEDLRSAYPTLSGVVDQAMTILTRDHNEAHGEIDDLYYYILDKAPWNTSTTTTTKATTTTTTKATTTTTTKPSTTTSTSSPTSTTTSTSTSTTRPTTTTTTSPGTTTTTEPTSSTTTTTIAGAVVPPSGPTGPATTVDDPASDSGSLALSAPPVFIDPTVMTADDHMAEMASNSRMDRAMVSTMLTESFSNVLPPALARFTVAPFVLVEVLVGTLFDSVRSMALPFMLVVIVMTAFIWFENRREPNILPG